MLDLRGVLPHIGELAQETSRRVQIRDEQLAIALAQARMPADQWATHSQRIVSARTRFLRAIPLRADVPPALDYANADGPPSLYTALATDGSQIPLDRHEVAAFTLLNVGLVAIHYGSRERPTLAAKPTLLFRDEDLLPSGEEAEDGDDSGTSGAFITERELATPRYLLEMESLADLIDTCRGRSEVVAFVDGTLILWFIEAERGEKRRKVLEAFLKVMERAKAARVPIVSYISRPGSRDVINTLRVTLCPDEPVDCKMRKPDEEAQLPYATLGRLTDVELFSELLAPGQRSGLYRSESRVLRSYPRDQRIIFCYLNAGSEIARLEMPEWVATDETLLRRVHALTVDQAQKGGGYPICLAEAHEQAVIHAPERTAVFRMVERALIAADQPALRTGKVVAKRRRSI
jgi:hypothetical protein